MTECQNKQTHARMKRADSSIYVTKLSRCLHVLATESLTAMNDPDIVPKLIKALTQSQLACQNRLCKLDTQMGSRRLHCRYDNLPRQTLSEMLQTHEVLLSPSQVQNTVRNNESTTFLS